jgi:hypothetical protein
MQEANIAALIQCRYMATYDWAPSFLKVYSPLLVLFVAVAVTLMEIRMAVGFSTGI